MRYWLWMFFAANLLIPFMAFMIWSEGLPWSRFFDFLFSPLHATHAAMTNGTVAVLMIATFIVRRYFGRRRPVPFS